MCRPTSKPQFTRIVKPDPMPYQQPQPPALPRRRPAKTVRFNDTVHVAPFERTSKEDNNKLWYSDDEMSTLSTETRKLWATYRKMSLEERIKLEENDMMSGSENDHRYYRGMETCTPQRLTQKKLSRKVALYACGIGMTADQVASVYQQCSAWSSDVAYAQAMRDFIETYPESSPMDARIKAQLRSEVPSVAAMAPPPHLDKLQRLVEVRIAQRKRRNSVSPPPATPAAATTTTERRVRPRIC